MKRLALLFLTGCAHPQLLVSATQPAQAPTSSAVAWLQQNCNACHDGNEPSRPMLGDGASLSPDLALRSAMMVGARRMPPMNNLGAVERAAGIRMLCEAGADAPAQCVESATSDQRPARIAPPRQVLDELQRRFPDDQKPGEPEKLLELHAANARADAMRIDPTEEVLLLLVADKRCPRDPAAFARCADYLLERGRFSPPEPNP